MYDVSGQVVEKLGNSGGEMQTQRNVPSQDASPFTLNPSNAEDKAQGGGGGGCPVQSGAAHALRILRKKGSFLRPSACPRFVKEGYFFVSRYEVWGENPFTNHEISAALTPSDSRSDWASESAATAKPAEDYKI